MTFHDSRVLFCSKSGDDICRKALDFLNENCRNVTICLGDWGDGFPPEMFAWEGDYILSFMSKWIIPEAVLKNASIAAINFHPAPPSRPGAACTNFALYDGDEEYGVTCHYMTPEVDSGDIIMTKKFPIYEEDSVKSLLARAHENLLELFIGVVSILRDGRALPECKEKWMRENFHTRKDLNEGLRRITAGMGTEELERRIRATLFDEWKPYLYLHGRKFTLDE